MEVSGQIHATLASLAVNKPWHAWNIRFSTPESLLECSSLPGIQPRLLGRTARSQPSIPNRLSKRKLVSLQSSAVCSLFATWVIWSPVLHLLGTIAGTASGSYFSCHIGLWPLLGTNMIGEGLANICIIHSVVSWWTDGVRSSILEGIEWSLSSLIKETARWFPADICANGCGVRKGHKDLTKLTHADLNCIGRTCSYYKERAKCLRNCCEETQRARWGTLKRRRG
jgi:hypothetical protein